MQVTKYVFESIQINNGELTDLFQLITFVSKKNVNLIKRNSCHIKQQNNCLFKQGRWLALIAVCKIIRPGFLTISWRGFLS